MSKSLKTIQVLFKIAKILSKIVFICCIIGAVGCIVGIISLAIVGASGTLYDGATLSQIIARESGMTINHMYAAISVGLVFCAAEIVIARFAEIYFGNELKDGTPFTFSGAKELMRLGIITVSVSVGASITAAIVVAIFKGCLSGVGSLDYSDGSSVAIGIMFLVISVIFRYGAEREEQFNSNSRGGAQNGGSDAGNCN